MRTEQLSGHPGDALAEVAKSAELLVLGSRGLGGIGGFMVGSAGLSAVAQADRPVVMIRARETAADEHELAPGVLRPSLRRSGPWFSDSTSSTPTRR